MPNPPTPDTTGDVTTKSLPYKYPVYPYPKKLPKRTHPRLKRKNP